MLFSMYICYVLFMLVNRPVNVWACLGVGERELLLAAARYEFTGTPLNKELREYVQEKRAASGKVEPEKMEEPISEEPMKKPDEPPRPAKDPKRR